MGKIISAAHINSPGCVGENECVSLGGVHENI